MADPATEELTRVANRQRRVGDAAKVFPALGAALILVPILWADGSKTSSALLYIFLAWFALIIFSAFLSRLLASRRGRAETQNPRPETRF